MIIYTGHCYYCGRIVSIETDKWATYANEIYWDHEPPGPAPNVGFAISRCPECRRFYVYEFWGFDDDPETYSFKLVYPLGKRRYLPASIPIELKNDFEEAVSVSDLSAKAAAALLRRLLQRILNERYGIKERNLSKEIEKFIMMSGIPAEILDSVDVVRAVGNFGTHPIKSEQTGVITEVEPDEVEWLITTLEALLDFAFVQPAKLAALREKVNKKLKAANREQLK